MGMEIKSATTVGTPEAQTASKPLDRDAFLKLLVAQLRHQDPTQPMQGTEFVTQLSQFSLLEQSLAQSDKLEVVSTQLRGLSANEAASLVGKSVTLRSSGLAYDGVTATSASVNLTAPAASVKVTVVDASGRAVRAMDLGARPAGALAIAWDGKDDRGQPLPKGSYSLRVEAKDQAGGAVETSQDVSGVVRRVSFEKGYPELELEGGVKAPVSDLVSVGK